MFPSVHHMPIDIVQHESEVLSLIVLSWFAKQQVRVFDHVVPRILVICRE